MAEKSLESRVAVLESDVAHIKQDTKDIKLDMRSMRGEIKAANDGIAALQKDVGVIGATVTHLATTTVTHLATKAELKSMEANMIRWFVGTAIAIGALAFTIARFVDAPPRSPVAGASAASSDALRSAPQD